MKRIVKSAPPPGGDRREFVLSDDSVDRMGDVIEQSGWDLSSFQAGNKFNPIALFNHKPDQVVGSWADVRVEGNRMIGRFVPLEPGTTDLADGVRKMIDQNVLRATSVGFDPLEKELLHEKSHPHYGPFRFKRQALLECSIVSVPANSNSVAIAKSLNISHETMSRVFGGEQANPERRNSAPGEYAVKTHPIERPTAMPTLSERIEHTQNQLNDVRDRVINEAATLEVGTLKDLNTQIRDLDETLTVLKESEARAASATAMTTYVAPATNARAMSSTAMAAPHVARKPFGEKELNLYEVMSRAAFCKLLSKAKNIDVDVARQMVYGDHHQTREAVDITVKAAVLPALTSVSAWAGVLVGSAVNAPLMESLFPKSVYPALSAIGPRLGFGRNGTINIPSRATTPTIAGSFVGENSPIPVRKGAWTSIPLTPKKMAVITTWSREMDEHSEPSIRPLLEEAIRDDTAISIDTVLLDATVESTIRPAGLRYNVSGLTPTAGGGFTALTGDISQLIGALMTSSNGNVRSPVFLMNPAQAWKIAMTVSPGAGTGLFPFREEINNGTLNGFRVIQSGTVTAGMVICLDAADFVSVSGDNPRFEVSDTATLHMEDTSPAQIGVAGAPAVLAGPVQSMFQTDSLALRLILPMNWAMRRTGMVSWVTGVTW